ncbi:MAG TPA: CehA/McbA family metallohydrolase [Armatimonadota bacterium]|jgi:hypothetical protein
MSKPDITIILEGVQPAAEAAWNVSSLRTLPFNVPEGAARIRVRRHLDPWVKHTAAVLLFDPRGDGPGAPGFRGYQGQVNTDAEFTVTGDPETTTSWYRPGALPAGEWRIGHWFLDAVSDSLRYRYEITIGFDGPPAADNPYPDYEPGVVKAKPGWYCGGLHNHTLYSYDSHIGGTPHTLSSLMDLFQADGYDFLAVTDHNQPRTHLDAAAAAAEHPDMLLILGNELTSLHGHANALFAPPGTSFDFRLDPGDGRLPAIIDEAHRLGALFVVNHPRQKCRDCTWRYPEPEWRAADAMEVWNRPWADTNRQSTDLWDGLLKQGRKLPAVGGADYHRGDAPLTPATWVYAHELSLAGVREAIQLGRAFLSESPKGPKLFLSTEDGGAMPGDTVTPFGDSPVPLRVRVVGGAGCSLRLITRFGERCVPIATDNQTVREAVSPGPTGASYLRAELLRDNGDVAALTNPIYVEAPAAG